MNFRKKKIHLYLNVLARRFTQQIELNIYLKADIFKRHFFSVIKNLIGTHFTLFIINGFALILFQEIKLVQNQLTDYMVENNKNTTISSKYYKRNY